MSRSRHNGGMESPHALNRWLFGLALVVLSAIAVLGPFVASSALNLDARTPANIAHDALYDNQGLLGIAPDGEPLKPYSHETTQSAFDESPGATTHGVPFLRDGERVTCTVHVPSDPADTTADCN